MRAFAAFIEDLASLFLEMHLLLPYTLGHMSTQGRNFTLVAEKVVKKV
jgi:hypothetical protein